MASWQPGSGFDHYGAQAGMQPGMQQGMPQAPVGPNNPLNDVFSGAGSGILGTYLGNSRDYVQSNVSCVFVFQPASSLLFQCWVSVVSIHARRKNDDLKDFTVSSLYAEFVLRFTG